MKTKNSRFNHLLCWAVAGALAIVAASVSAAEDSLIEDRLLIIDALAQYSYRWDGKDSSAFAELFTDDGIIERRVGGELVAGSRVQGRPAILEYARQSHEFRLADRQTRHHFSALTFLELDSSHAVTQNMALITHQTAGSDPPFINGSGIYRITWRKTTAGWKMTNRVLHSDRFIPQ